MRFMKYAGDSTPRGQAKDAIERMILSRGYKVGDKLPTYRQLAAQLGIAARTFVRAMHELSDEGIVQLLHGRGVFLRKMPAGSGKMATIGLAYHSLRRELIRANYLNQMLAGIISVCDQFNIDLQLISLRAAGRAVAPQELGPRLDGMILLEVINDRYICEFAQQAIPLVLADAQTRTISLPCVVVNNSEAVNLVMDHLHGLGHRRIAYVDTRTKDNLAQGREPSLVDTNDTRERREAYLASLRRLGLEYERIYAALDVQGWESIPSVTNAFRQDKQPPTAIMCYDISLAALLCQSMEASGTRVAQDVSIAAAAGALGGNLVDQHVVTCVVIDFSLMGQRAAQVLHQQSKSRSTTSLRIERISGTLHVGTTTAKPSRT